MFSAKIASIVFLANETEHTIAYDRRMREFAKSSTLMELRFHSTNLPDIRKAMSKAITEYAKQCSHGVLDKHSMGCDANMHELAFSVQEFTAAGVDLDVGGCEVFTNCTTSDGKYFRVLGLGEVKI